jgi:hypothetical protein
LQKNAFTSPLIMNTKRRSFLKTLIGGTIGIFAAKKTVPEIKADNYEKTYQERSLAQPMSGTTG